MNTLTLHWQDKDQNITQHIYEQQSSKNPGTVRLGRDPLQCDIILTHPTVSGLHVEIFFHAQQQQFYIRNLREPNPPLINNQQLIKGEMALGKGSIIYLGQQKIEVTAISVHKIISPTIIPPQLQIHSPTPVTRPTPVYGLQCSRCHKISPAENLKIGCPWCGTSLAAAVSVLVAPSN
ncbi:MULTISPECIES: FHA domain-containing protein [unclassified Anabaena]|uniref:FHA domain-containing protein n=1 Tax=unclassified Anabaena TaxID=2619674 RepID=UPI00144887BE|nr:MULTISPECIES: FHA domain-containing protein [unclassified Anabaena]MTJ06267.1 FHA domain-containing protein [Anabaena sp. UHCC 0204]MTJ54642.1 FHA domain-containing protein [Anabaena sp. UHCC 0253]